MMLSAKKQLELIVENIPGCVLQCRNDKEYSIIYYSAGFLTMLGYSDQDIQTRFGGKLLNIICEEDRTAYLSTGAGAQIDFELELRLAGNNGIIWALNKGQLCREDDGSEYYLCVLIDITRTKDAQQKLLLEAETHSIILGQTQDIVFEWDLMSGRCTYSSNWKARFGSSKKTQSDTIDSLAAAAAEEDRHNICEFLNKVRAGSAFSETELRLETKNGLPVWCRLRVTVQYDAAKRPARAVGIIMNIDADMKRTQLLIERAERDPLTRLYNKSTVQLLIEQELNRSGDNGTLLIVDIDDFKNVNDTFGHLFGDGVLTEFAARLGEFFEDAIIGRIGGDEFLVYLKHTALDKATVIAKKAVMHLKSVFSQASISYRLSCSIGIAQKKLHGKTFKELYRKSDIALYKAKKQGKQQFVIYDESMGLSASSAVNMTFDDSTLEEAGELNSYLIENVLKILYSALELEESINQIMEFLGKYFDVSRVYIFENTGGNKFCSNSFEWCNDNIQSQIGMLQGLSYEDDLVGFFDIFDEEGICYCADVTALRPNLRDILTNQSIKSILLSAIKKNGEFVGFIGFDDCENVRSWTKEQIKTLRFITEILNNSLFKGRELIRTVGFSNRIRSILDSIDSRIYVVDKSSSEILYANKSDGETPMALKSHKLFDACLASGAGKTAAGRNGEVIDMYFDEDGGRWYYFKAIDFVWETRQSFLINVIDFTEYVEMGIVKVKEPKKKK